MTDLAEAVRRLSPQRRDELARTWEISPTASPLTVADLVAALQDPFVIRRRWTRLDDRARAVLAFLVRHDEPITAGRLADQLGVSLADLTPQLRLLAALRVIGRP